MKAPAHLHPLLSTLADARACFDFDPPTWDRLIRIARRARLLGVLSVRISQATDLGRLDESIRRHLIAGRVEADFRRQKTRYLLSTLEAHLDPQMPCVLLKGAAYILQGLAMADGRLPADVDAMVPRATLDRVEQSLLAAGWQYEKNDPYDQRYYREWSHELPPLSGPGHSLELDLHHTILPPLGRLKPDTCSLFQAVVPIEGTRFGVLCPADQVLHAAAHLFQDSDCTDRLRDLVDFDALVRTFAASDAGFWTQLVRRAELHQLGRPLWYSLRFARAWLGTPVPAEARDAIERFHPAPPAAATLCALVTRALPPVDPDGEPTRLQRVATKLLEARANWLRMPPRLVAYHVGHKITQAISPKPAERSADAAAE